MKVSEVLQLACNFTGSQLFKDKQIEDFSEDEKKQLDIYLNAYQLIIDELASDYNLFVTKEEFVVKDGKLNFSDFKFKPLKILSVKSRHKAVRFKTFEDTLCLGEEYVQITYAFAPPKPQCEDEVIGLISGRVLAYGVAREISLMQGLYGETEIWEGRFKDGVKMFLKRGGGYIFARRWR